ncbi:MAG TPA: hypothetical protein VNO22_01575 [Planctomycetota bacterium]|nr:hypothetical protein [Planctomycetota bacterium]
MSWRRTVFCSALVVLGACAGGGGGRAGETEGGGEAAVLKISHFRAFENPRTKKLEPTYRVVISESWRDRVGEGVREPFPRAAPGNIYRGIAPDARLRHYVQKLREYGLDDLVARNPDDFRPEELRRLAENPQESSYTRIFTVGTDKGARSYYYRDQQKSEDLIKKFFRCEAYVLSIMNGHTIRVQTGAEPFLERNP